MTFHGRRRRAGLAVVVLIAVAACGAPIAANPAVARPSPPVTPTPAVNPPDPQGITFPADDAPHHRLTEWWYYTGHLRDAASGARFGFEFVIFRAERGAFPVSWASHLALTDEQRGKFFYAQRTQVGPDVDHTSRASAGSSSTFDLRIGGDRPAEASAALDATWSMTRGPASAPVDHLVAGLSSEESQAAGGSFAIDLNLADGPAVFHNGNGWIDFGPAGGSYYYSRPRMPVTGTLSIGDRQTQVAGEAWFDHQWGDFIAVGGGGWDWFAINLEDGTDLTLSLVRDAEGHYPLVYGTLRRASGDVLHLRESAFTVTVLGRWTSPTTGTTYPAGWRLEIPTEQLTIDLEPTVAGQELDTRPTTGVIYWEGSQVVRATKADRRLGGDAYVELTGYATAGVGPSVSPSP